MPYQIIRGDITNLPFHVDAIVNTAHPYPQHGLGTDAAIFKNAGPRLTTQRQFIGQIQEGKAEITPAYELDAKIIIHTVAPVWRGGKYREEEILTQCYTQSLLQAVRNNCHKIAFPLIGSGNLGFPKPIALKIAINSFTDFCFQHDIDIYLVLFDQMSFEYGKKLHDGIPEFINNQHATQIANREYCRADGILMSTDKTHSAIQASRAQLTARKDGIDDVFRDNPNAGFSETMRKIMAFLEKEPPDIYQKIITPQAFLKTFNNDHAKPKKPMALTISIALMLNLEQTELFIERAGHALNPHNSWDNVIINAIETQVYSVDKINAMLKENGHTTFLGSK